MGWRVESLFMGKEDELKNYFSYRSRVERIHEWCLGGSILLFSHSTASKEKSFSIINVCYSDSRALTAAAWLSPINSFGFYGENSLAQIV